MSNFSNIVSMLPIAANETNMAPFYAAIATAAGAVLVEITRRTLNKTNEKNDYATVLRDELRVDINSLKKELIETERQLDEWKQRCYNLMSEAIKLNTEINRMKLLLENQTSKGEHDSDN